jgi:hypothetical protein
LPLAIDVPARPDLSHRQGGRAVSTAEAISFAVELAGPDRGWPPTL